MSVSRINWQHTGRLLISCQNRPAITQLNINGEGGGWGLFLSFQIRGNEKGMEHVLKKLHPLQNVGNLFPFLPQLTENEQILQYSRN